MSKKQLIYAVEDDVALQELYVYALESDFECKCFANSKTFFAQLNTRSPQLIILDIMLPGDDGFKILAQLKASKSTAQIPVIMVSAKGEEITKVKGLNMGADDYIAKPFGVLEFVARVKANLRKAAERPSPQPKPEQIISYKDVHVDSTKYKITISQTEIQTTLKEYKLLRLLCQNAGRVLHRDEIFSAVWGSNFIGESRTLDIHIKELRHKLHKAGSLAQIETIRGVGYILS